MEENNRNNGQGLGVAALIMGIISFVVAFIPCIGIFAFLTAAIAIVLAAIGISQASRTDSPKGLMVGGLVVAGIALFISIAQIVVIAGLSDKAGYFEERLEDVFKDFEKEVLNEFEDGNFSITIEDGDEKVEIKSSIKKEMVDKLHELEGDKEVKAVDITVKIDTSGGNQEDK